MTGAEISAFKKLVIIHKAMLFGQILFAAVSFYLVWSATMNPVFDKPTEKILQIVAILFSAAGFFGGTFLMKKKILEARDMSGTPAEKFNLFRSTAILQWAMLEGPALLCIICFLLSGNYALLALAGALIIFFSLLAPTRKKLLFQLNLSEAEVEEL